MKNIRPQLTRLLVISALLAFSNATAEQKRVFGEFEVHYIILPTLALNADIAARYSLPRGRDRALVNLSVLDAGGKPVPAEVRGHSENLLGQGQELVFSEVKEGDAIYYLALLRHADEEFHRVALYVVLPNEQHGEIRFQQQMFWNE